MVAMTRRALLQLAGIGTGTLLSGFGGEALGATPPQGRGLRFEIFPDARGEFRWRLKAANSRIIAKSDEGYRTAASCKDTIAVIMKNAASATIQEVAQ